MDEGLLSSFEAGRGQLLKMLITFVLHGIFESNFVIYFSIVQSLVCKMVTRLCRASFLRVHVSKGA